MENEKGSQVASSQVLTQDDVNIFQSEDFNMKTYFDSQSSDHLPSEVTLSSPPPVQPPPTLLPQGRGVGKMAKVFRSSPVAHKMPSRMPRSAIDDIDDKDLSEEDDEEEEEVVEKKKDVPPKAPSGGKGTMASHRKKIQKAKVPIPAFKRKRGKKGDDEEKLAEFVQFVHENSAEFLLKYFNKDPEVTRPCIPSDNTVFAECNNGKTLKEFKKECEKANINYTDTNEFKDMLVELDDIRSNIEIRVQEWKDEEPESAKMHLFQTWLNRRVLLRMEAAKAYARAPKSSKLRLGYIRDMEVLRRDFLKIPKYAVLLKKQKMDEEYDEEEDEDGNSVPVAKDVTYAVPDCLKLITKLKELDKTFIGMDGDEDEKRKEFLIKFQEVYMKHVFECD